MRIIGNMQACAIPAPASFQPNSQTR